MIHESVSKLQLQPYGWIQSANYIIAGILICAFAVALRNELEGGFGILLIPLCHIIMALGCIVLGLSLNPQIQLYAGGITFIFMIAGYLLMARRFATDPQWRGWVTYTIFSVALMIVLCALFTYSVVHKGNLTGVFERMLIITRLVWLFFFSAKLLGGRSLGPVSKI